MDMTLITLQTIVTMVLMLSSVTRRIPTIHSFSLPISSTTTTTIRRRNYHGRLHDVLTMSVHNFDTSRTSVLNERRRPLRSSSNGSRHLSSFSRSGGDKLREGLYILARSEANERNNNEADKEFNLFDGIPEEQIEFRTGLPIIVEVISFGPLGASVAVIGKGESHDAAKTKLADSSTPLATGLIYQNEIRYYREARRNVDVVLGEILPAYVERVREDGKIDVSLRVIGGRARVDKWSGDVLFRLEELGELPVGNKSTPMEIAREFPGMSKSDFKKCIGSLFERKLVFPFSYSVLPYEEGLAVDTAQREADGLENDNSVNSSSSISADTSNNNSSYNGSSDSTRNSYSSSRRNNDGSSNYKRNDRRN